MGGGKYAARQMLGESTSKRGGRLIVYLSRKRKKIEKVSGYEKFKARKDCRPEY